MTKTKQKSKEFHVMAKIDLELELSVWANTLEEALEKARALETKDFVEVIGASYDDNVSITGLFED